MNHTTSAKSLRTIAARLEAAMDACRPFGDAQDPRDLKLALASLLLSCHVALDSLAAIGGRATLADMAAALGAPPISGGAPVAEVDPADVESDPAEWPEWTDNWFWEPTPDALESEPAEAAADYDGPLPLSVLEASAPPEFRRYAPTLDDWNDYHAWCVDQGYGVTDRDLIAAGLAVG